MAKTLKSYTGEINNRCGSEKQGNGYCNGTDKAS